MNEGLNGSVVVPGSQAYQFVVFGFKSYACFAPDAMDAWR
jgi:hypothetical protein